LEDILDNVGKNNKNIKSPSVVQPINKRTAIEEDIDEMWEGGSFEGNNNVKSIDNFEAYLY